MTAVGGKRITAEGAGERGEEELRDFRSSVRAWAAVDLDTPDPPWAA